VRRIAARGTSDYRIARLANGCARACNAQNSRHRAAACGEPCGRNRRGLGAFFRSSEVALEGEKAPRNVIVEYRSLPSGIYEVRGVLVDARGKEVAATRSIVTITGIGTN
jgi:hypothetical protein